MLDINSIQPAVRGQRAPELEQMAKAHPAAALLMNPAWNCPKCGHKNPVTEPFCEKCPE